MMGDSLTITDDHRYFNEKGEEYVGVTSVTSKILNPDAARFYTAAASTRGTAVHLATAFDDMGTLDEESVDDRIRGYVEAWRAFRRDSAFDPAFIETRVWCDTLKAAGTLDRVGTFPKARIALLDIKSGVRSWTHDPQLAAYDHLRISGTQESPADVLGTVYLRDDGTYDFREVEDRDEALTLYLSGLNIAHARRRYGA